MHHPFWLASIAVVTWGFCAAPFADAVEVRPPLENKITQALTVKHAVHFKEVPLREAIKELSALAKVPITIDDAALQDEGVDPSSPITLEREAQTLAVTLRDLLNPFLLIAVPTSEWVQVTTQTKADEDFQTRVYDVSRLISLLPPRMRREQAARPDATAAAHAQFGGGCLVCANEMASRGSTSQFRTGTGAGALSPELMLLIAIQECSSGQWEMVDGVGGAAEHRAGRLIIQQPWKVHREIMDLLTTIEAMLADPQHPVTLQAGQSEEDQLKLAACQKVLDAVTKYPAGEIPLQTWVEAYLKDNGVPIYVDHPALEDEGISWSDLSINIHSGVSRKAMLDAALRTAQITLIPDAGRHIITTVARSDEIFDVVVYDVSAIPQADDVAWLKVMLNDATSGPWEEIDGVGGTVGGLGASGLIAVRQTHRVHTELAELFASLRLPLEVAPKATSSVSTSIYALPDAQSLADLQRLLPKLIDLPDVTWPEGSVEKLGSTLVIRQTDAVHRQIETIVDAIQKAPANKP